MKALVIVIIATIFIALSLFYLMFRLISYLERVISDRGAKQAALSVINKAEKLDIVIPEPDLDKEKLPSFPFPDD